jgi:endonuclease YncB( thermonuclease family)
MSNSLTAFALLVAALLVFIISTRQWPLGRRALIWGVGAALLLVAAWLSVRSGAHEGLLWSAIDTLEARKDSVMVQAVEGNRAFIGGYVAPMLDLFLGFAALAGLLALLAFTPGEGVERVVRALSVAVLGGVAGGIVALAVVAVGFGGYPERQVFFDTLSADDVVDGDTIRLGDVAMHLAGIDAPEYAPDNQDGTRGTDAQLCFRGTEPRRCGAEARDALVKLVAGRVVICAKPADNPQLRDSYGRPLVRCEVRVDAGSRFDLAYRLAQDGYAIAAESSGGADETFATEIAEAAKEGRGIWSYCLLKPISWRNNSVAKKRFVDTGGTDWDEADVVPGAKCAKAGKAHK